MSAIATGLMMLLATAVCVSAGLTRLAALPAAIGVVCFIAAAAGRGGRN